MESRSFYNEILTEHNMHPDFKHDLPDADIVLDGVNPSCGDEITLKLKVKDGVIADGAFVGDGCAVSQASADIMLGKIIGQKTEDALRDIAHMPARVKCAMLGWRTLAEALGEKME